MLWASKFILISLKSWETYVILFWECRMAEEVVLLGLLDEEVGDFDTTWAFNKLGGQPVSICDTFLWLEWLPTFAVWSCETGESHRHLIACVICFPPPPENNHRLCFCSGASRETAHTHNTCAHFNFVSVVPRTGCVATRKRLSAESAEDWRQWFVRFTARWTEQRTTELSTCSLAVLHRAGTNLRGKLVYLPPPPHAALSSCVTVTVAVLKLQTFCALQLVCAARTKAGRNFSETAAT